MTPSDKTPSADDTFTVIVDLELCDGHAQCEVAAPEVFRLDEDGELQYVAHPPAGERVNVERAVRLCPVQAIKVRG